MFREALHGDQLLTPVSGLRGSLEQVSVNFGRVRALDDVTVALEPGLIGLLGVNGAGKTTLLRVVAGALKPRSGRVLVTGAGGENALKPGELPRLVGYLPQSVLAVRGLTARQYMEYFAFLKGFARGEGRVAAASCIDRVGLSAEADKATRSLSGGMLRRLGLAAALLGEPALLLLDEPMAGLDPEQRQLMRRLIAKVAGDSTVVLSTHLAEDVSELASSVCVLDRGRVRFSGGIEAFVGGPVVNGAAVEFAFLDLVASSRETE